MRIRLRIIGDICIYVFILQSSLKKAVVTAMVGSLDWIDEHFPKDANMCIVLHGRPVS